MDFFTVEFYPDARRAKKWNRGKNVLAIDLLFLMVITICASLLQYGAENHLLNYEPFWKIQLFYSGYWAAAVSLCSPFKTPSPLAIKERKSFPGHSSVLQHYSQEEKKSASIALQSLQHSCQIVLDIFSGGEQLKPIVPKE